MVSLEPNIENYYKSNLSYVACSENRTTCKENYTIVELVYKETPMQGKRNTEGQIIGISKEAAEAGLHATPYNRQMVKKKGALRERLFYSIYLYAKLPHLLP
jgi:hypothetical protein